MKYFLKGFILLAITVCSCTNKKELLPDTSFCTVVNAKYSTDVSIIIQTSCATNSACHASGSINGPGPLLNYTAVKNSASAIKIAVETRIMPRGSTLSDADINKIKCWVESGALNN